MIAAASPVQRPPDAQLLVMDGEGSIRHLQRSDFVSLLRPGDLVVANDAATLPASLAGHHARSGEAIEVRLAAQQSLQFDGVMEFAAVMFGEGDFRMRTEDRPAPPRLAAGDRLELGPMRATISEVLGHPRLVMLRFDGTATDVWEGIARHGRPVQYSHVRRPLAVWDTWTSIAAAPAALEPPSAGFVLDWQSIERMAERQVAFRTLTHAAGLSSTGDPLLDARLPFAEPYRIPASTANEIEETRWRGGRVIAIGTTVVRALEHAASVNGRVPAGEGLATQRIGRVSRLRVVDALLSGTHEPGTSHHELLRALVDDAGLERMDHELEVHGYRTHEFGDSVLVVRGLKQSARTTLHAG